MPTPLEAKQSPKPHNVKEKRKHSQNATAQQAALICKSASPPSSNNLNEQKCQNVAVIPTADLIDRITNRKITRKDVERQP